MCIVSETLVKKNLDNQPSRYINLFESLFEFVLKLLTHDRPVKRFVKNQMIVDFNRRSCIEKKVTKKDHLIMTLALIPKFQRFLYFNN